MNDLQDLLDVIALHREMFSGWTMTAGPAEGGAPAGTEGTEGGAPAGTEGGAPAGTEGGAEDISSLPEWAQKVIKDARAEAQRGRTNAKATAAEEARKQLTQELGKALGLVQSDEKVDPNELKAQLAAVQEDGNLTKVQMEAMKIAIRPETGVNAIALLDSNSFLTSIKGLAPTDSEGIAKAIQAAVAANPTLKAAPAAAKSGAEFSGGTGEKRSGKSVPLEQAVRNVYAAKS